MNAIISLQNGDPRDGLISKEEMQDSINPGYQERNITEGGEFLDDGMRMKDQPLGETNAHEENDRAENTYDK